MPNADAVKAAWEAFMAAVEVQPSCEAYAQLRAACEVGEDVRGHKGFMEIVAATASSGVSFRIKNLIKELTSNWDGRIGNDKLADTRIVISGAGPVGLRAAVECALMGMTVTVLEKRSTFSRVNILTLFRQTADDLIAFGGKAFYPKFTNLGERLHLGTREIQLIMLKNALLLGVRLSYGTTLVGVQVPDTSTPVYGKAAKTAGCWRAWAKGGISSHDFKSVTTVSAETLKAADLAAEESEELEMLAMKVMATPDASSHSMVDLSEELAVIEKGAVKQMKDALKRQSAGDGGGEAPKPLNKPMRKKKLGGVAAMFEKMNEEPEPPPGLKKKVSTPSETKAAEAEAKAKASKGDIGALDFKPNKMSDYERAANQGLCNYLQQSALDRTFALGAGAPKPDGADKSYAFDALLLAEGEWSATCKKLSVTKAIDRFSLAIGLVINLEHDAEADPSIKPLKSFVQSQGLGSEIAKLHSAGIIAENVEFLKGETLYIAATIKKASFLNTGVLKEDLPGPALLTRENVNDEALLKLARQIATLIGISAATKFCNHHPAKLFDFSTRARCLAPFKVLATATNTAASAQAAADATAGTNKADKKAAAVIALDLSAHPFLASSESNWLVRNVDEAVADVEAKKEEIEAIEAEIAAAAEAARQKAVEIAEAANVEITEEQLDEAASVATQYGREKREQLVKQLFEREGKLRVAQRDEAKWKEQLAIADGHSQAVPVFPIGDSLLEPFWPQGLGSNRGFHSALDTAHSIKVLKEEGLEAALLDRLFSYDVMVQVGGAFPPNLIQPGNHWRAEYTTRYIPSVIVEMMVKYTNPSSKRLFKGPKAIPPWVQEMKDSGKLKKLEVELSRK